MPLPTLRVQQDMLLNIVPPLFLCACVVQRKKTLLVEYKQLRKANTFIDKRFGGKKTATAAAPAWSSLALALQPNSAGLSIRKAATLSCSSS
jgi:hypothetical protein